MAKTYQNVIDDARILNQDTDSGAYRNEDATYISRLNLALQELGRLRPDAYWDQFTADDIVVPILDSSGLTGTFAPPVQFYTPIVEYVAGAIEMIDDEFADDGRAATLLTMFKTAVLSL